MAAALVGGAFLSAFLQVLFDRMASREVVDFFRSRKLGKGRLLQKLKAALLSANAVLDDAEEKQMTNEHVREWLDELKDAVYDADDLFDEIATEDLKREAGVEPRALVSKVWSFAADACRSKLGDKLERVLERLESVVKQREVLGLRERNCERTARASQTTSLVEESGVFGREKDREAVIQLLLSDRGEKNTSVLAIVGMGGVGKTTLSQLVFNDGVVKGSFELRAWVCVSDQFDICKLTATALEEFSSSSKKETENLNQLQLQLKNFLTGKKFLLVLDDVWNEESNLWDAFLVPFTYGARGSKIVVTTRNEGVASVARAVSTYPLQKLQDEESWDLFAKHAFDQHNFEARTRLEEIGQRIVKRCDGLPLALKTIGSLLRCESGIRKWEIIAESDIWDLAPGKNEIIPALLLSYHYLPPQLKRCFAYCSIFPKDCIYGKDQLILLWIAEGFIKQPNDSRTLEELGDQCFCDLVSRSLLHRVSDVQSSFWMDDLEVSDVEWSFSMHDLVNDLARYVAGRSFFSLDGGNAHQVSPSTRHLSFVRTHYDVASRFRVLAGATNLRTFLPLNVGHVSMYNLLTDEVLHVLLPTLRRLRVLSLSHYWRISTLPSSIGCLKHLRYLNLSYNKSLSRLPDTVTALYNLQTLILAYCPSLIELPSNMGNLTCLRHLDIRWTSLKRMPLRMNRLKNLQILTNFVVAENGGTRVRELRELGDLMGTLSIQGLQNVDNYQDAEIVNLQGKRYLKRLVLRWGSGNNIMKQNSLNVLDKLQPHWNLRELAIISYSGRSFSDWVGHGSFSNMSVVRLKSCKHCVSLPPLGQLPSLEKLIIEGFDGVTSVGTEFNGSNCIPFQSLKYLEFAGMCSWKEWASFAIETGDLAFAHLQELCIRNCPELSGGLPSYLPSLTALSIEECPQLTSSLPFAPLLRKINLDDCGKVSGVEPLLNGTELREMKIKRLSTLPLRFLPPTMTRLNLEGSREIELPIHRCHESLQYLNLKQSCDSLISFPLEIFPSLKDIQLVGIKKLEHLSNSDGSPLLLHSMDIRHCPEFRSFPAGGLATPCLTSLVLFDCCHLKYLPENMQALLPSLGSLTISSCPQLESFPERGLPSKLVTLSLSKCDKLITDRKDWGLQSLCSLETFSISVDKNMESFPEIGLLPTSLTSLRISFIENLTSLNSRALHSLSSLENLSISNCPKLHSFPKEGQILPASLTTLTINLTGLKSLDNLGLHHLTRLKEFYISSCGNLLSMPAEGLSSSLSNLFIEWCPSLAKRCQGKKGKDWPRVSHIRCIVIDGVLVT